MTDRLIQKRRGGWTKAKEDRGVYRRGRVWYIRYADENGKLRAERVGFSKADALTTYRRRKEEVAEGRLFPERVRRATSFDELVHDAVAACRQRFEITYPGRRFRAGRYEIIAAWFEGRKAASITPQEIRDKLAEHCRTAATHNRFRVAISHVYKLAMENRKATENPGRSVRLLAENNERVRWLTDEEEAKLRTAIGGSTFPERDAEVSLALNTGLRQGEQYGLRWLDVDWKLAQITIPQAKSGKREQVPINTGARDALRQLRTLAPKSDFVCPLGCGSQHRRWWAAVLKEAKIEDFHWHDLRHTFASRLAMDGVDIFTVNRLMRHKTMQMTMRYSHLSRAHLHAAAERLMTRHREVLQSSDTGSSSAIANRTEVVH